MKIILNQDVVNLGEEGDVVTVKDGYARNFLLPTKQAVLYTKGNAAIFESRKTQIEARKAEKRSAAASLKEKLDAAEVRLVVPAGESGKLFGSVTSAMVQDALSKMGIELERKKIDVPTHAIKMTGAYTVVCHLYENESSHLKVVIESELEVKQRLAAEAKKAAEEAKKAEEEAKKAAEEAAAKEAEEAAAAESEASAEEAEPEAQAEEPKAEEEAPAEPSAEA